MEEVLLNQADQVPLWAATVKGDPDWETIYNSHKGTTDRPKSPKIRA